MPVRIAVIGIVKPIQYLQGTAQNLRVLPAVQDLLTGAAVLIVQAVRVLPVLSAAAVPVAGAQGADGKSGGIIWKHLFQHYQIYYRQS